METIPGNTMAFILQPEWDRFSVMGSELMTIPPPNSRPA